MSTCLASIGSVRRALVTRVLATCLVVLAVLPFTAPFSSFDLAKLFADSPCHETLGPGKEMKEASGLAGVFAPASLSSTIDVWTKAAARVPVRDVRLLRLLALRI